MSDAAKKDAKASEKPPVVENTENLKILAAIGYLGILFLVPYLTNPKSEFAVFHANQGLLLFIAAAIVIALIPVLLLLFGFMFLTQIPGTIAETTMSALGETVDEVVLGWEGFKAPAGAGVDAAAKVFG